MRDFVAHVRQHLPRRVVPRENYHQVVDELASQLEARYTALMKRGATDEEAWREVLKQVPSWSELAQELGAARTRTRMREHPLRVHVILAAERWLRELRHGLRSLRQDFGYTVTAIVTLAIGLGGHAAIAAGVDALLLHPLRTPEPDRVLLMANQYPRVEARRGTLSATPDYADRLLHVTALEEQSLYNYYAATIEVGRLPTLMRGMVATPSLFRLLRVNPVVGRTFTDDEGALGNEARVLLTEGLWRERFGGDPEVIGRALVLSGRQHTIVGVLPRDFSFGDPRARFWVPLALTDVQRSDEARYRNGWMSIGRLKAGATIEQVRDQLKALDAVNAERMPPQVKPLLETTGFYTGVEPLQDTLVRDVRRPLSLLWGAALAVLVIGVANLANIAMARSRARLAELGTRLALGAEWFDVFRQVLTEGLLIALGGGVGGLALGAWMLSMAGDLNWSQLHINPAVAGITISLAAVAGLLIGLVSASPLYTTKIGTMLHEGTRGSTPAGARATRRAVVVVQMACSFVLVMGATLLWVSVRNLLATDPGFRTEHVLTGFISLPSPRYAGDDAARAFVNRSLESIRRLPGVGAAGATTVVPVAGVMQTGVIMAEGYVPQPGEPAVSGVRSFVTPGYFEAIGTPLVRGRYFDERDAQPDARTIIIDERLAHRFWPDGDALGQRLVGPSTTREFTVNSSTQWLTVIGVVRAAQLGGSAPEYTPSGTSGTYYIPAAITAPRAIGYVILTKAEPTGIVNDVRSALAQIDPEIPLSDIRTMTERIGLALLPRTNTMHLAMLFACAALFLSAIGLYGTLAYLVTQRRREIGVRLAVGSTPGGIVKLMFREGFVLATCGLLLGAVTSLATGRLVASQLYGIAPSNPSVMLATGVTLSVVTALACVIPARRAASVDVVRILTS